MTDYATVDQLKERLNVVDTVDDALIARSLTAASRQVDGWCGRTFAQVTATRFYDVADFDRVLVDDLVSITTLATDDQTDRTYATIWDTADYDLDPSNGPPYTQLRLSPRSARSFPVGRRTVRIAGVFGWPAIPAEIGEATLLLAARLFKRKDAPMGVQMGKPEFGTLSIPGKDPDVERLLQPYRVYAFLGV